MESATIKDKVNAMMPKLDKIMELANRYDEGTLAEADIALTDAQKADLYTEYATLKSEVTTLCGDLP